MTKYRIAYYKHERPFPYAVEMDVGGRWLGLAYAATKRGARRRLRRYLDPESNPFTRTGEVVLEAEGP